MTGFSSERVRVGISACLLGMAVRHDGGHRRSAYCVDELSRCFEFQPVCPEVEAGLGAPRRAMHLVESANGIRLRTTSQAGKQPCEDYTQELTAFNAPYLATIRHLRGFILMAKSPSCGMERVRIYNEQGDVLRRDAAGLFADALMKNYPLLPVEEAGRLQDERVRENFIARVYFYEDWCRLTEGGLTSSALLDFHSSHKFQLLAHHQGSYRELGPLLGNLKAGALSDIAAEYINKAMRGMRQRATVGSNVNVMQHMAGYLRSEMDVNAYGIINEHITAYQRGEVPLIVPMTLIRNAQRSVHQPYLARQHFLSPYPDALGLRNRL